MSKEDLEFPGEPIVRVKDPSALEFPEVPRAQTGGVKGVKHDLVFPEGEEAREAKSTQGKEASEAKSVQGKEASESETLEYSLESSEERRKSGSPLCASPRPGRVFSFRALTAVAQGKEASESETLEYSLESSEERRKSGSPLCASPRPGRVFSFRALTAVAVVALVGSGVAAVRPLDVRLRAVLVVPVLALSVVAPVVACGARGRR